MRCCLRYGFVFLVAFAFLAALISGWQLDKDCEDSVLGSRGVSAQSSLHDDDTCKQQRAFASLLLALHPISSLGMPRFHVGRGRSSSSLMGFLDDLADFRDKIFEAQGIENPAQEVAGPARIDFIPQQGLPGDFDESVSIALQGCLSAVLDGNQRIRIEFKIDPLDDEAVPIKDGNKFLGEFLTPFVDAVAPEGDISDDEETFPRLQVVFNDEGSAALALKNMNLPTGTVLGSLTGRSQVAEGVEVVAFFHPRAKDLQNLQRMLNEIETNAPMTTVLLVNPQLIDRKVTMSSALVSGVSHVRQANAIMDSFRTGFWLSNWYTNIEMADGERKTGVIYSVYPEAFSAWYDDEGQYQLVSSGAAEIDKSVFDGLAPEGGQRDFFTGVIKEMQSM